MSYNDNENNSNYNNSYNLSYPSSNDYNNSYNNIQTWNINTNENSIPPYHSDNYPYGAVDNSDAHYVVEVPIKRKMTIIDIIILVLALVPFLFFIIMPFAIRSEAELPNNIFRVITIIMLTLMFVGIPVTTIIGFASKKRHLKRVCTTPVTGKFIGYETQRRKNKYSHYYVHAPKYEIFINNRYEIRTIDNFSRYKNPADQADVKLLANADGYEIIFAEKRPVLKIQVVFTVIVVAIFLLLFLIPFLVSVIIK